MNWYKEIKFADSPLPSEIDYDKYTDIQYSIGPGINHIDGRLHQEEVDKEKKIHPSLEFLGAGVYGLAYDVGRDIVVKYTVDEKEYASAKRILKLQQEQGGKNLPGIVTVFYAEKINSNVWKIILEKADPLSNDEKEQIYVLLTFRHKVISNSFEEFIETMNTRRVVYYKNKINKNIYYKYKKLLSDLLSIGANIEDAHEYNVKADKNGNYIMVDLGRLF